MCCIRLGFILSLLTLCAAALPAQGGDSMRGNTGRSANTEGSSTPMPEPATLALLALGAGGVGLAMRGRRRAKKQHEQETTK